MRDNRHTFFHLLLARDIWKKERSEDSWIKKDGLAIAAHDACKLQFPKGQWASDSQAAHMITMGNLVWVMRSGSPDYILILKAP